MDEDCSDADVDVEIREVEKGEVQYEVAVGEAVQMMMVITSYFLES